jgi:hypothetical protein
MTGLAAPDPASSPAERASGVNAVVVTRLRFSRASQADIQRGLLGYIAVVVNDALAIDGITLRRTAGGRVALSYPARRDTANRQHALIRPLDRVRSEFECQIFAALALEQGGRLP